MIPVHLGTISPENPDLRWKTDCFTENEASFLEFDDSSRTVKITLHSEDGTSWFCDDHYLLTSRRKFNSHWKFFKGDSTFSLRLDTDEDYAWLKRNGVSLFVLPCGLAGTAESLLQTVELFSDSKPDKGMEFMSGKMGYVFEDFKAEQVIDKKFIKSGDELHIFVT
eukprot:TRINITY_DN3142_c0_g1_i2.p1 TRINITY_DN3142_c0_g1~~TRINITY_DN3142_c0_g1_i2.p1  ORF type:complete len:166 (-),score=27.87 TRINITY_DN3142_c0_g1_i2:15-512(-)